MIRTTIISHALVLTFAVAGADVARADDVPELNVDPVCRGIAQQALTPGEKGGPDLAFFPVRQGRAGRPAKARRRVVDLHAGGEGELRRI